MAPADPSDNLEGFLLGFVLDHVVQLLVGAEQGLDLLVPPPHGLGVLDAGVDALGAALDARGALGVRAVTLFRKDRE